MGTSPLLPWTPLGLPLPPQGTDHSPHLNPESDPRLSGPTPSFWVSCLGRLGLGPGEGSRKSWE